MQINQNQIKKILDAKVKEYNNKNFITNDPICIPHKFTKQQDIEIAAFFAAILAWGNRTSIINSCNKLMGFMDNAPYQFITQHQPKDVKKMIGFVHRTYNTTDLLYTISFLQHHFAHNISLETAFFTPNVFAVQDALIHFRKYFFSLPDAPQRTAKHIATPQKNSACKRLNMLLRWMVRNDVAAVDFGIWKSITPASLICPLDVHVSNVANRLGILPNNNSNWSNALLLTNYLSELNPADPCIYDYALFSLGVVEKFR